MTWLAAMLAPRGLWVKSARAPWLETSVCSARKRDGKTAFLKKKKKVTIPDNK